MRRELTDRERALLDFERDWQRHESGKEAAINDTFTFSASRYYKLLADLAQRPAAMDYDPLTVTRLRRRRQRRLARRIGQAPSRRRSR